jgi:phosphoribosylamine--glycine ligase
MKILVLGSGGREHAIAWRLAQSGHQILGAPGNPGIAELGETSHSTDYLRFAQERNVDLTIVGPEAPLVAGIVDQFRSAGLPILGPTQQAAQLEASKIYSKRFMERLSIPTARAIRIENDRAAAFSALDQFTYPVVIKASGLMAGKGVIIASSRPEADAALETLGPDLVIEEFLKGEEVSFIALCDGKNVVPLEPTQDHKRIFDGDQGPNTGGMGAYCDSRILRPHQTRLILDTIIQPVVDAAQFSGFLYAGLMMTAEGPKVLEFNVRLGDPETQALMHRVRTDLGPVFEAAARGELAKTRLEWSPNPSVVVVASAEGYPGTPVTGDEITGITEAEATGAVVFQAGTKRDVDRLLTAGGRVLGITASGPNLPEAIRNVYRAVERVHFRGIHFRRDIGQKGLSRWPDA